MRAVQNEKEARGGLLFHPIPPVLCSVNCYGNVFNFSFSDSLEATLRYENKHQLQQWWCINIYYVHLLMMYIFKI